MRRSHYTRGAAFIRCIDFGSWAGLRSIDAAAAKTQRPVCRQPGLDQALERLRRKLHAGAAGLCRDLGAAW